MRLETLASIDNDDGYLISRCLIEVDGRVRARGSGKGRGRQAWASATFEAVEHYFMLAENRPWEPPWIMASVRDVAAQRPAKEDRVLRMMRDQDPAGRIACAAYQGSDGSELLVPVTLADIGYHRRPDSRDTFDYRPFLRYCSTNGVTSGVARADGTLHGVLELIERDAVSRALMGVAGLGRRTASVVPREDVPGDLYPVIDRIQESGIAVSIYELECFAGARAFHALGRRPGKFAFAGSGTSLWADYALERAVTELWQDVVMTTVHDAAAGLAAARTALEKYPPLWRTADPSEADLVGAPQIPVACRRDDVGELAGAAAALMNVIDGLHADGLVVYSRVLIDDGVSVVSTYVPGLERFCLMFRGSPMMPTGRPTADAE